MAFILVLGFGTAAFAEDRVYEFDQKSGGMSVQVRCNDANHSEEIKGVTKIVFSDSYIHIETKDRMLWFPKESVQRIHWFKAKKATVVTPKTIKPPVKAETPKKVTKLPAPVKLGRTPREALKECIALLKQKKYVEFVKGYLHPDDYKKMDEEIGLKALIEGFQVAKAAKLLKVLEGVAKVAKLDEVGGVAKFKRAGGGTFAFYKHGERWYIKN
ncbi:MAG: hypothetical protein P1V97_06465 [Planctomycetota bacterium]|nr:hypothetical protein [Planctomycetota bacterium]